MRGVSVVYHHQQLEGRKKEEREEIPFFWRALYAGLLLGSRYFHSSSSSRCRSCLISQPLLKRRLERGPTNGFFFSFFSSLNNSHWRRVERRRERKKNRQLPTSPDRRHRYVLAGPYRPYSCDGQKTRSSTHFTLCCAPHTAASDDGFFSYSSTLSYTHVYINCVCISHFN